MTTIGFWAAALALSAAVLAVLISSLRHAGATSDGAQDQRVYRDQLAEIDRDETRATLAPDEALRLRTEVSRRLLDADRRSHAAAVPRNSGIWGPAGLMALCAAGAIAGYLWLGAPGYPDLPLTARLAMADQAYAERATQSEAEAVAPEYVQPEGLDPKLLAMIDKLRTAVAKRPDDLTGHTLLAGSEASLGNYPAALAAQRDVMRLKGDTATAEDHASFAEAMIMAAGGLVTSESEDALKQALILDPRNGTARYYSGLMFAQIGRPDRTFALWQPLLDEGPAEAPWITPIRSELQAVADAAGINYALPDMKGPSQADVAAAAEMSGADRKAMIEGMVAQLSDRLKTAGGPAEDWAKLIKALGVLGQTDRARANLAIAAETFKDQPDALRLIMDAAAQAGVAP